MVGRRKPSDESLGYFRAYLTAGGKPPRWGG